jgi:hypothetical protein
MQIRCTLPFATLDRETLSNLLSQNSRGATGESRDRRAVQEIKIIKICSTRAWMLQRAKACQ